MATPYSSFLGLLFSSVLFITLLSGCATNPVTGKREFVTLSENQEITLGQSYHPQIIKEYGLYDDPELQAYVQQIGSELAKQSHRQDIQYHFHVLDSPVVNAFALPGGYIYITRGIMAYLNSEAELAGVLGHEIGHVTARHAVQRHAQTTTANLLNTIILMKTQSQSTADLVNLFGGALISGYGRKQELQSDKLGSEYLARSGYNPDNMLNVVKVLKNQETFENERTQQEGRQARAYHGLFATHPENDKRLKEVIAAAKQFEIKQSRSDNRKTYLQHINGMVFGQSEAQGITRQDIFYHPVMAFTLPLPKDWHIENLADRLILSDPSNEALLQITVDDIKEAVTPEAYLKSMIGSYDDQQAENLLINGLPAFTAVATKQYDFGNRDTRFIVIFYNHKAYLLIGLSKNIQQLEQYDDVFLKTAKGFHKMTPAERNIAKPYRIRIIEAKQNTSYVQLAKQAPFTDYPEERLRLLNAHYPKGVIKPGQNLKIIR